jgi:succinate-acetate transporter protein
MLALPAFIVGSVMFGMVLIGVVPATAVGAGLPVIITASLALFLATVWAGRIGENAEAGFYGVVASFFMSYAVLVLGLTHNWFGIAPTAIADTRKMFVISWIVIVSLLVLAALRLPVIFLALFLVVDAALVVDLLGIIQNSTNLTKAAGWITMGFAALGVYLFVGKAFKVAGGKEFPHGRPLIKA